MDGCFFSTKYNRNHYLALLVLHNNEQFLHFLISDEEIVQHDGNLLSRNADLSCKVRTQIVLTVVFGLFKLPCTILMSEKVIWGVIMS